MSKSAYYLFDKQAWLLMLYFSYNQHNMKIRLLNALVFILLFNASFAQYDTGIVRRIQQEGFLHSQVMDIAFQLTDVNGPRLTGSEGYQRAASWVADQFKKWQLSAVTQHRWGNVGKSWELKKFYLGMTVPYYRPIAGIPKAWSSAIPDRSGTLIVIDMADSLHLNKYKGQFRDKFILIKRNLSLRSNLIPDANRFTEEQMALLGRNLFSPRDTILAQRRKEQAYNRALIMFTNKVKEMASQENAIAILSTTQDNRDGTFFSGAAGSFASDAPDHFPNIDINLEDYQTFTRLYTAQVPVKLDVVSQIQMKPKADGINVLAEIKGTDPVLKKEVIMIGAHLDSWHAATGATDNAAGSAVMMEAIRILQTLQFTPKRTIRIALWGGEEQGLLGSRQYVKDYLMDTVTGKLNEAGRNVVLYLNLDNGTGKIRGIYTQQNKAAMPFFEQWFAGLKTMGSFIVTNQNTDGTDHLSFDAVGIPGFQFIQDQLEYHTRTHHSNADTFDHLYPEDLKQAAVVIANLIYRASMEAIRLPAKAK